MLCKKSGNPLRGQRLAEQVALDLVTAEVAQIFKLPLRFDAFGDDFQLQDVADG